METEKFKSIYNELRAEEKALEANNEYNELLKNIVLLEDQKKKLEQKVTEKKTALLEVEKQILLQVTGEEEVDGLIVKYKTKKDVDTAKLVGVIGDIDAYVSISSVTQKSLKEYAKERADIKKPLLGCIVEVEKTPVSLSV